MIGQPKVNGNSLTTSKVDEIKGAVEDSVGHNAFMDQKKDSSEETSSSSEVSKSYIKKYL